MFLFMTGVEHHDVYTDLSVIEAADIHAALESADAGWGCDYVRPIHGPVMPARTARQRATQFAGPTLADVWPSL